MGEQLALTGGVLSSAHEDAVREALRYLSLSLSVHTQRAYALAWRGWLAHCAARCIQPLPVRGPELVLYLTGLTMQGRAPAGVRLVLSALASIDQRARVSEREPSPSSVRSERVVREWYRGWSRSNPRTPRTQARHVNASELDRILRTAQEPPRNMSPAQHVAAYARDRAMLLVGIAAALRVSELVALDLTDITQTDRGLRVHVRTSKTNQEGLPDYRGILPQGHLLRCPVDAWLAWRRMRGDAPGAAFVGLARDGTLAGERLSESAARRLVVRRAKAAGIDTSSHCMRATFATLAVERGAPVHDVARHGHWASLDTLAPYVRQAELFERSPTAGLLDD